MDSARDLAPFVAHGGRVGAARAAFGDRDWLDLSTGIAPWPWPIGSLDLGLGRLPGPEEIVALEEAAGGAFGVADGAHVIAVPGTDLAMRLLAAVISSVRAAVVRPGYSGHAQAWPGARAIRHDALGDVDGADLLVLADPANPDGRTTDHGTIRSLAQRMTMVVDEAYADPAPGLSPEASDRLVTLRSFGKFYGLPGARLGFVVTGSTIAAGLRRMLGDWPVSGPAVAIGTAAYRDSAWRAAQQGRIASAGDALDRVLAEAGLTSVGGAPLFRLIACDDGAALFRHLARRGILTRPFADQPRWLRIGLPADDAALARLRAALSEFGR